MLRNAREHGLWTWKKSPALPNASGNVPPNPKFYQPPHPAATCRNQASFHPFRPTNMALNGRNPGSDLSPILREATVPPAHSRNDFPFPTVHDTAKLTPPHL